MTHFVLFFLPHEHQICDLCYYWFISLFYWIKCLVVVDKEKVNSAFLAEWGRSLGDRSGRRDESHPGCSHWLLWLYKYKQMEHTGTEQAETSGEGHGQAGRHREEQRKASCEAPWTHHLSLLDRTYSFPLNPDWNQWRRDARVRNYLWNPAWIPARV